MSRNKKKVLVTGVNGQLGEELVRLFSKDSSFLVFPKTHQDLDIINRKQVGLVLQKEKPDIIIHCAAWTNVDAAARTPEGAMKVNAEGTKNICEAAQKVNAKVVYISTNEVFDGKKGIPYLEDDHTNPINAYGESKLKGEQYCQSILGDACIIVRSSWLYGPASINNFPNKIMQRAQEQGFLRVVNDEISTPTYTPDLAAAMKKLLEKNISGIFHLVNRGRASRYDWAKEILNVRKLRVPLSPVKLCDFRRRSTPPENSVLANIRARRIGVILPNWRQSNKKYLQEKGETTKYLNP